MIKTLPVQPRRQGNFCALDAARRNSRRFRPKKLPRNFPRNFKLKSCVVRILVNLRWTSFLLSAFFITAAEAAPGDKMELVRDLAGRVGPVIGSALACPDITRPRIQSVIEKFAAVIRDAASNEAQRSDLAQLFDRSVADGRNAVTSGRTDCRLAERRLADLEQSLTPSAPAPAAAAAPAAPAFAAAPRARGQLRKSGQCGPRHIRQRNPVRHHGGLHRPGERARPPDEARHRNRLQPGQRRRRRRGTDAADHRRR